MKRKNLMFLFVLFLVLFSSNVFALDVINNLYSYYPFTGNTSDMSGSGFDATNHGATLTTDKNTITNQSYSFDGSNDYMSLPQTSFSTGEAETLSFWVYPDTTPASSGYILAGGSDGNNLYRMRVTSSNQFAIAFKVSGTWVTGGKTGSVGDEIVPFTLNISQWNHIAMVINSTHTEFYLNGNLELTSNLGYDSNDISTSSGFSFGREHYYGTAYYDGKIDEFRSYNRTLTSSDISYLYSCYDDCNDQYNDFEIYLKDIKTDQFISNFSVYIDGVGDFFTTNGTIQTNISDQNYSLVNISFYGNNFYENISYSDINVSLDYTGYMKPYFYFNVRNSSNSYINFTADIDGNLYSGYGESYITNITYDYGLADILIYSPNYLNYTNNDYNLSSNLNVTLSREINTTFYSPYVGYNTDRYIDINWTSTFDPLLNSQYNLVYLLDDNYNRLSNILDGRAINSSYFSSYDHGTYWLNLNSNYSLIFDNDLNTYVQGFEASAVGRQYEVTVYIENKHTSKYTQDVFLKASSVGSDGGGTGWCTIELSYYNGNEWIVAYNQNDSYSGTGGTASCSYNDNIAINDYAENFSILINARSEHQKDIKLYEFDIDNSNTEMYYDTYLDNLSIGNYSIEVVAYDSADNYKSTFSPLFELNYDSEINITAYSLVDDEYIDNFNITVYNSDKGTSELYSTTTGNISIYTIKGDEYRFTINNPEFQLKNYTTTFTDTFNEYTFLIYTTNSINFTFRDSVTGDILDDINITLVGVSDLFAFNFTTGNGNYYIDLLSPSSYTLIYSAYGYTTSYYYLNLANRTHTDLDLYLTNSSNADLVTIYTYNQNTLAPQSDVYVKILRFFPDDVTYKTVQISKTNFQGITTAYLEPDTTFYRFILEYPQDTVVLSSDPTIITVDTLYFYFVPNTSQELQPIYSFMDIKYSVAFNNNTNNFRFTWDNSYEYDFCLRVYDTTSLTKTLYNESCTTSQAGTILINVDNTTGKTYEAKAYYSFDGSKYIYLDSAYASFINNIFNSDKSGLFIVAFLTMIFAFAGYWNPAIMLLLTPLPLIFGSIIGIIHIQVGALISLYVFAIILVVWFNNKV